MAEHSINAASPKARGIRLQLLPINHMIPIVTNESVALLLTFEFRFAAFSKSSDGFD